MPEFYEEERDRDNEVDRHRENSSRLAHTQSKYHSTGQGAIQFPDRVDFGLTFIEEPWMSFGCYCDVDDLAELLNIDSGLNDTVPFPLVSGFVTEWDRDERDFYIGAFVGVRVWFPETVVQQSDGEISVFTPPLPGALDFQVPVGIQVQLDHYFTFTGIAMKDIPLEGAGDDD